jgi:phosphoglycerate dehydrogenase-like enzyme
MKVAAGVHFFKCFGEAAQNLWPSLSWSLLSPDGKWSSSPRDAEIAVLIDDGYSLAFKEAVLTSSCLRWVHTENSGVDGEFYEKILARNVLLTRSPGANAPEVAEFVFAVILRAVKKMEKLHRQQQDCCWRRIELEGLSDKIILVIGVGEVGGRVAKIAKAFGMYVLGISKKREVKPMIDEIGTLDDLAEFLPRADVVVLALPLSPEVFHLFDAAQFQAMKEKTILVNIARGQIINIEALHAALIEKPDLQACLDVMPYEPWPAEDPLWQLPNIFLTPHVAWSSPLYRPRAAALWLDNLTNFYNGLPLLYQVGTVGP